MQKGLKRYGTAPIETILPLIKANKAPILVFGIPVSVSSVRMRVFKRDNGKCVGCGKQGHFFGLEKFTKDKTNNMHLNLYHVCKDGGEMLMTLDHIIPDSMGGHRTVKNGRCLCYQCNHTRANCVNWGIPKDQWTKCECHKCDPELHKVKSALGIKSKRILVEAVKAPQFCDEWVGSWNIPLFEQFKTLKL